MWFSSSKNVVSSLGLESGGQGGHTQPDPADWKILQTENLEQHSNPQKHLEEAQSGQPLQGIFFLLRFSLNIGMTGKSALLVPENSVDFAFLARKVTVVMRQVPTGWFQEHRMFQK